MKSSPIALIAISTVLLLNCCNSFHRESKDDLVYDIRSGDPLRIQKAAQELVQRKIELTPALWKLVQETGDIRIKKACFSVLEAWGEIDIGFLHGEISVPVAISINRIPVDLRREYFLHRYEVGTGDEAEAISRCIFLFLPLRYHKWLESLEGHRKDHCGKEYLDKSIRSSMTASTGFQAIRTKVRRMIQLGDVAGEEFEILLWAVGKCGNRNAFEFLTEEVWQAGMHNLIMQVLRHFPVALSKDFLVAQLSSGHWAVRMTAAFTLAHVGDKTCVEHIGTMLRNEEHSIVIQSLPLSYSRLAGKEKALEMSYNLLDEALTGNLAERKANGYRHMAEELKELSNLERQGYLISR